MRHLRLLLEDGAHQAGEAGVDVDDLLELVHDQHHRALALAGELSRQFEQPLQRRIDVLSAPARVEAEAQRAVLRIDRHRRADTQALEDPQSLFGAEQRRGQVLVDRASELLGELRGRRCRHQVDVRDQSALPDQLL